MFAVSQFPSEASRHRGPDDEWLSAPPRDGHGQMSHVSVEEEHRPPFSNAAVMQMTFEASSSVTLLFDFWTVQGPPGMVLSVLVVCLLTVFFEFLKMWRIWLGSPFSNPKCVRPNSSPPSEGSPGECISVLTPGCSQSSLAPIQPPVNTPIIANGWMLHSVQTGLHVLQVALGYMLMLCVMSYNVWIFLGVLLGAGLGYFLAYPLIGQITTI
ncbi:unnamed protein product [Lota lota]